MNKIIIKSNNLLNLVNKVNEMIYLKDVQIIKAEYIINDKYKIYDCILEVKNEED